MERALKREMKSVADEKLGDLMPQASKDLLDTGPRAAI